MKSCPICKAIYPADFTVCPKDGVALRPVTEFEEGAVLRGKYQILAKLGTGGMGTVYKARHLHFNEVCALKVIRSHLTEDANFLHRFRSEAMVMRRLHHPNAVRVQDFDETEDGRPFMVMEYVEGESLDKLIAERAPLDSPRAVRIASQVCAALEAAHQLGIIHRDIKPANILLATSPEGGEPAKVLDFGVAKVKEQSTLLYGAASLTGTGFVVGTPAYMSPEQAQGTPGEELDGRTDLYSVGVVLYEMLTGRLPFDADTPVKLMLAHVQSRPLDPRVLRTDLPDPLARVILRALEKDPNRRPASAAALRQELEAVEKQLAAPAPLAAAAPPLPAAPPPRPAEGKPVAPAARPPFAPAAPTPATSPWVYTAIGGLLVLILVVGIALFRSRPAPTSPAVEQAQPTAMPTESAPAPAATTTTQAPAPTSSSVESPKVDIQAENPRVRALLQSARDAYRRGDREAAAGYLQEAYALDPNNPTVQDALRRAKLAVGVEAAASKQRKTQEVATLMRHGREALDHGRYDEAIRAFQAVLALEPNHREAQQSLTRARRALGVKQRRH